MVVIGRPARRGRPPWPTARMRNAESGRTASRLDLVADLVRRWWHPEPGKVFRLEGRPSAANEFDRTTGRICHCADVHAVDLPVGRNFFFINGATGAHEGGLGL